jgi:hypothetical protein
MDQAISQFRFVERRIGIRWHDHGGNATGHRSRKFSLNGIQAGAEINQARTDHAARRIDGVLSHKAGRCIAQCGHLAIGNEQRCAAVNAVFRVNDSTIFNHDIHLNSPQQCS